MPERRPDLPYTEADLAALTSAMTRNFPPCTCGPDGSGRVRMCPGHTWLHERDQRSVPILRLERLQFIRQVRARFIAAEYQGCHGCRDALCPVCERVRGLDTEPAPLEQLPF